MRGPPDLKCERAARQGSPVSHSQFPCIENPTEAASDLQAEKLQRLYFYCRATACTIAALAFAGCPR
jgi:hypothetical protein